MDGKYYWLKLKRDFFKRHDIRIIEEMPNGKDYILFYLKLLCESVDHNGNLRFSDTIPYSEQMLAVITNTNEDVVHRAVEIFTGLEMMELLDDGTYFMAEVENMTGSCANNENANRVRRCRERKKTMEQNEQKQLPEPKKKETVKSVIADYTENEELREALKDFSDARDKMRKPLTVRAIKIILNKLDEYGNSDSEKVAILNESIEHSWQSVFPLKKGKIYAGKNDSEQTDIDALRKKLNKSKSDVNKEAMERLARVAR